MLRSFLTLIALQLLNCRPGNSQANPSEAVKLRLANGQSRCAGRVEVYYRGQWGTVHGRAWDLRDAGVVCGELGCGTALSAPGGAHIRERSGPIVTYDVQCRGTETALRECLSGPWGHYRQYGAAHSNHAGVICSEHKELRLVNGKHRCEGRVEVFYHGRWGTVCSEDLRGKDAAVICEQANCGPPVSIDYGSRRFGVGSGPIWLDDTECLSQDLTLRQCQADPWGKHNCTHRNDAGIVCSGPELSPTVLPTPSVSSSIDSFNQIENYTSHSLGDTNPGSEYPEVDSSSIQAPALTDSDDAETEIIDSDGALAAEPGP